MKSEVSSRISDLCMIIVAFLLLTTALSPMASGLSSRPDEGRASIDTVPTGGEELASGTKSFTYLTDSAPESLDPAIDYELAGGEVLQNCYETLVWYDGWSERTLAPQLATQVPTVENGLITPDGKNYTFQIREGVMFHDGTTMDVYDVEYSLERALTINYKGGPAWMLGQVMIPDYGTGILDTQLVDDSVTVDGATGTVTVHLVRPYPAFIYVMAHTVASIVSDEYVEAHGGVQALTQNEHMNDHEAGTGPYRLVEWIKTPQSSVHLESFSLYWREEAAIHDVWIKEVDDHETRVDMLLGGQADSIYVPRENRSELRGIESLSILEGLYTFDMNFVGFNQDIDLTAAAALGLDVGNIPADFFADRNVRLAFCHAFDSHAYINEAIDGYASNGVIPHGMFAYPSDVPRYDYDTDITVQYLVDYLYNTNDTETGRPYAETGLNLTLFYNAGNPEREFLCLMLKDVMENEVSAAIPGDIFIGVQALNWSEEYIPASMNRALPMFFLDLSADYADPDYYVNPCFHENGTYAQRCGLEDPTMTAMVEEAASELNSSCRIQLYEDISMRAHDQGYYLWTNQGISFHVEGDWVYGYMYNNMHAGLYYYALDVSLGDEYEPDDTWDAANPIEVKETQTHKIDHVGDVDWVSFTLTEVANLVIETSDCPSVADDTCLSIYNASGVPDAPMAVNDDCVGNCSRLEMTHLEPGTYYVKVNESGDDRAILGYQLSLERPCSERIQIDSDQELIDIATTRGWEGDGTSASPFIIEDLYIDSEGGGHCISIGNTTLNILIRNCTMENATRLSGDSSGVYLNNARNIILMNDSCRDNRYGICVMASSNISIVGSHCDINRECGIWMVYSDNSTVLQSEFLGNYEIAMHLFYCDDNLVQGNIVFSHWKGILLDRCHRSIVNLNEIYDSSYGVVIEASVHSTMVANILQDCVGGMNIYASDRTACFSNQFHGCGVMLQLGSVSMGSLEIPMNNTVNGRPILYISDVDMSGSGVPPDVGQVILMNVRNAHIQGLELNNTTIGVQVIASSNIIIDNSTFDQCDIGIYSILCDSIAVRNNKIENGMVYGMSFFHSDDIIIQGNDVSTFSNIGGIRLFQSNDGAISDNTCSFSTKGIMIDESDSFLVTRNDLINNSGYGLEIKGSDNITCSDNRLIGNNGASCTYSASHVQAYDDTSNNIWNLSIGNYWGDWTSPDGDGDGIVDSPYAIGGAGGATDRMPLVDPYDHLPPVLTIISPSVDVVATDEAEVAWTGEDASGIARYDVRIDDGEWMNVSLSTNHTFSSLAAGEHTVDVRAFDQVGLSSVVSVTFSVDLTPPTVTFGSPGLFHDDQGRLEWTCHDDASDTILCRASIDHGEWVDLGSAWSYSFSGLSDGIHVIEVAATDEAGRESVSQFEFTVDANGPDLTILCPEPDSLFTEDTVDVAWEAQDEFGIARYEVYTTLGGWIDVGLSTNYTFTDLPGGQSIIEVRAWDTNGRSTVASVKILVDLSPPLVDFISQDLVNLHDVTIEWEGWDDTSDRIMYHACLDDGEFTDLGNACSVTFPDVPDGEHQLTVRAEDNLGRASTTVFTFKVDTVRPCVGIVTPSNGTATADDPVIVSWNGSDASGIGKFEIRVDHGVWTNVRTATSYALGGIGDGPHYIEVRVWDIAGNSGVANVSFMVDRTAPEISILHIKDGDCLNGTDLMLSWNCTDETTDVDSVSVRVDGEVWILMEGEGYDLTSLTEGAHMLEVCASDILGNSATCNISVVIDNTAPEFEVTLDKYLLNDRNVAFGLNVSDDNLCGVMVSIDNGEWTDIEGCTEWSLIGAEDGDHIVTFKAIDLAGWVSSATLEFTVDTRAPALVGTLPQGTGAPLKGNVSMEFDENIASINVTLNGEAIEVVVNGSIVRSEQLDLVPDQVCTVSVEAMDAAGNLMFTSWQFTTKPTYTITGRVVDGSGEPIANATVTLENGDSTVTDEDGGFIMEVPPGENTITVSAEGMDRLTYEFDTGAADLGNLSLDGAEENVFPIILILAGVIGVATIIILVVTRMGRR